jgi:hypothetical protein
MWKTQSDGNPEAIAPNAYYERSKQPENLEYLNYLGNVITNDAKCTQGIKFRINTPKVAVN